MSTLDTGYDLIREGRIIEPFTASFLEGVLSGHGQGMGHGFLWHPSGLSRFERVEVRTTPAYGRRLVVVCLGLGGCLEDPLDCESRGHFPLLPVQTGGHWAASGGRARHQGLKAGANSGSMG